MEYGLIGEKLGHSFSKEVHGLIADYDYRLLEIPKNELENFMHSKSFRGINVTIPYKEAVIPFVDEISEEARKIGAVNTIVNRNGRLFGYNTDYMGALGLIRHADIEMKGKKVLILGSGGTCKTLSTVVRDLGAQSLIKVSRKASADAISYDMLNLHYDAEVIINTTPVGMFPKNSDCPIDIECFPKLEGVVDVIYNPLDTVLIRQAKEKGIKASGGLYMLVAQAVYASELFLGVDEHDEERIQRIFRKISADKENIVLIGMPSSGKSSVGSFLGKLLNRAVFDSDEEVVGSSGKSIKEIFESEGESAFRMREKSAIAALSQKSGCIIATGGGAVLDAENVMRLKQNGRLFFLDRSLEKLEATGDRPLSDDHQKLKRLYEYRRPIYLAAADFTVCGDGSVEETAVRISETFNCGV